MILTGNIWLVPAGLRQDSATWLNATWPAGFPERIPWPKVAWGGLATFVSLLGGESGSPAPEGRQAPLLVQGLVFVPLGGSTERAANLKCL